MTKGASFRSFIAIYYDGFGCKSIMGSCAKHFPARQIQIQSVISFNRIESSELLLRIFGDNFVADGGGDAILRIPSQLSPLSPPQQAPQQQLQGTKTRMR